VTNGVEAIRRGRRRFVWCRRRLWWRSYTVGGFDGYRSGRRRVPCDTLARWKMNPMGVDSLPCDHPADARRTDTFRTAVSPIHPGYSEARRVTCERCGVVVTETVRLGDVQVDYEPGWRERLAELAYHIGNGIGDPSLAPYAADLRAALAACPPSTQEDQREFTVADLVAEVRALLDAITTFAAHNVGVEDHPIIDAANRVRCRLDFGKYLPPPPSGAVDDG